ncbi:MAG: hypothetical protein AB9869_01585 [Verrucomicrobiia bacterium]
MYNLLTKELFLPILPFCLAAIAQAQGPAISIERLDGQSLRLSWPDTATGYVLEWSTNLSGRSTWAPFSFIPIGQDGQLTSTLTAAGGEQYFRLRGPGGPLLTTILKTSPEQGAASVSLHRETILDFSAPLNESTVLTRDSLHADVGGRRVLSRIELSSDRRKATLFYLEPLPAAARVQVRFIGDAVLDAGGLAVDADGDGAPGGVAVIQFDTMSIAAMAGTEVVGHVYASDPAPTAGGFTNRPLQGVLITVDGAEETLRATTDASGFFRLSPSPAGRFFVHIDGRPAVGSRWPDGAYYPYVGKTFEAVLGQTNNLAGGSGEIFLPLIKEGTLAAVSSTAPTAVTFPPDVIAQNPALEGVNLTIPANSLFADDGTRGGRVGIAPVPADRIPSPLPPGLEFPLVITVQTDGPSNFDQPVPVRFPNLPDPVTGKTLPAGAKTQLWSFNHDTGNWEPQGAMTVTVDGNFVESDPGVGIRQPGWHGVNPGSPPVYPEPRPRSIPEDPPCDPIDFDQIAANAKEDGDCFAQALPFYQAVSALFGAAGSMADLLSSLGELATGDTVEAVHGACTAMFAIKDLLGQAAEGLSTDAVKNELAEVLECELGVQIHNLEVMCKIASCLGDGSTGAGAQACLSLLDSLQELQSVLESAQEFAEDPVEFSRGAFEEALRAACEATASTEAAALSPIQLQSPGQLGVAQAGTPIDSATLAVIRANAAMATTQAMHMQRIFDTVAPIVAGLSNAIQTDRVLVDEVYSPVWSLIRGYRNAYYRMSYGGFEFRGRSTSLGQFELPILAPETEYTFEIYDPTLNLVAMTQGTSQPSGATTYIADPVWQIPGLNAAIDDEDGDGLTDAAEQVVGTRADLADTDGDGPSDLEELRQGQNPLTGLSLPNGVIAALPLRGEARDLVLDGTRAYVATGSHGLAVVDISAPSQPLLLAELDLSGLNRHIVFSRTTAMLAILAESETFLGPDWAVHLISLADPQQPALVRSIAVEATALAEENGLLFVAVGDQLRIYDITTGNEMGWDSLPETPTSILAEGELLFMTWNDTVSIFSHDGVSVEELGTVTHSLGQPPRSAPPMVKQEDILFVGTLRGYITIDVSNPSQPRIIGQPAATQLAMHSIALTGSGILAAVTSFSGPSTLEFSLYDASDVADVNQFLTTIATPGNSEAVVLANGFAFVADDRAGFTVLNYLGIDTQRQPPEVEFDLAAIDVDAALPGVQALLGSSVIVWARASDDVQLREARLIADNAIVATIPSGPLKFELELPVTPPPSGRLALWVEAVDTGGNVGVSPIRELELVSEIQPPQLVASLPRDGAAALTGSPLVFRFDEPLQSGSRDTNSASLLDLGSDGVPGGGDDTVVPLVSIEAFGPTLVLTPGASYSVGPKQLSIPAAAISDRLTNRPAADLVIRFTALAADPNAAVWISTEDGRFDDPANWLYQRAPSEEGVILPEGLGQPVVSFTTRDLILASLESHLPLRFEANSEVAIENTWTATSPVVISNSSVFVSSAATFTAPVHLTGSTLQSYDGQLAFNALLTIDRGAKLVLDGASAGAEFNAGLSATNFSLVAQDGAVVSMPQLTNYQSLGDFTLFLPSGTEFRASGPGSKITLPELVSADGPVDWIVRAVPSISFHATGGGSIELPKLALLTGRTALTAAGANSFVSAPRLTSITGPVSDFLSSVEVSGDSELELGDQITLTRCVVTLESTGTVRAGSIALEPDASIKGVGSVDADLVNRGSILLDRVPGSLEVRGDLELDPASAIVITLGLGTTQAEAGHLNVLGNTAFNGLFRIVKRNGYTAEAGDQFVIGNFQNAPAGAIVQVDDSDLGPALKAELIQSGQEFTVRIVDR